MNIGNKIIGGFKGLSNKLLSNRIRKKTYTNGWSSLFDMMNTEVVKTYKSYAYACINARAENIAKARVYLKRKISGNQSGYEEVKEHPFLEMIGNPNIFHQSFEILLFLISASLDLNGNAYILIDRKSKQYERSKDVLSSPKERKKKKGIQLARSGNIAAEPKSLYFLPYENTRIIMDENNRRIISYEYREGNKMYNIPEKDVIHFSIPSPSNNTNGKSLVSAFNYTLDIEYFQNLFQRSFYANNASIGLILECSDNLTDEQFERIETKLDQKYTGVEKSGRPLILEGGLKASNYKPSVKDVEMIPARKMIRDEILAIFRVPKTILGILEDVNYAGSKEAIKIFNDYTIKPFAKLCIESKLNIFLKENYSEEVCIAMEYDFETDRDLQLKAYEIYRKYDIVSIEEIREMEGFSKTIKN